MLINFYGENAMLIAKWQTGDCVARTEDGLTCGQCLNHLYFEPCAVNG